MTLTPHTQDLPEGFEDWPADIQNRYLEEYRALYFPELADDEKPG